MVLLSWLIFERIGLEPLSGLILGKGRLGTVGLADFWKFRLGTVELADFWKA